VRLAADDAGLRLSDVDGLLVVTSPVAPAHRVSLAIARQAGLRDLRLLSLVGGEGTGAVQAIQLASLAVATGTARAVACVFADTPRDDGPGAAAFAQSGIFSAVEGLDAAYGAVGWATAYALAARRYLARFGAPDDAFGPLVLAQRRWAQLNPLAAIRTPLTVDEYRASRWVVEPLRLLDCALPVNGAIAVLVVAATAATDLRQPPVYILGAGQGHPGRDRLTALDPGGGGVPAARAAAFGMAGVGVGDVDACQFYDPFSYVTLARLEDYGFCGPGEAMGLAADGRFGPGGALPVNTGGGHLSGGYLQGMTPVAEAVCQVRGQAGARQVPRHDVILVTGDGGVLDHHACLLLGAGPA
jgi:acetyl-CoA acetyltransferase